MIWFAQRETVVHLQSIARSSLSRSEIVVPAWSKDGEVVAVLDIDSKGLSTFDDTDRHYLEQICKMLNT